MSILSGYQKVKRYIKNSDGYKKLSQWTSSNTVEMDNGNTVEEEIETIETNQTQILSDIEDLESSLSTTTTTTGNPISVSDSAHVNAEGLVVTLEPIQSGSGDPSPENIRPISGYDSTSVVRSGKNLCEGTISGYPNTDSMKIVSGNGTSGIFWGKQGQTVYASATDVTRNALAFCGQTKPNIGDDFEQLVVYSQNATLPQTGWYCWYLNNAGTNNVQIELGSTATSYEPYTADTYTLQFGDTVYGAEVDFVSGVATVTKGYIAEYAGETLPSTWISDRDVYASGTTPTTGAEVAYELATPTTIQLTPQQIKMLKGNNVLVADGDMDLVYQVDNTIGDVKESVEKSMHSHNNKQILDSTTASYTSDEKTKLSNIAPGAEVNQNAFSNVTIGSTNIAADTTTDTLTLAGSNVTLTPDTANDKVTIGITKDNVTSALGYTPGTGSSNLALGETSTTAYRGDRGKTAYDHSQSTHARTDATAVSASSTNGNIKINGTETTVYTHPSGTNPHGTTKSDVGLGNVGNFKAVSTDASQGLTTTEQANARANIGAGTSSFSGSYNDLSNKPTIPTVNNATLTIQKNGTNVQTFTANQSSNATANIIVPTKVSELTNDSGYTSNTGTITGVKMNGVNKGSSGVVDLGNIITDDYSVIITTTDGSTYTCNKTYSNILTALQSGLIPKVSFINTFDDVYINNGSISVETQSTSPYIFMTFLDYVNTLSTYISDIEMICIRITSNNAVTFYTGPIVCDSISATAGGGALSLVTTGEKYTWNQKQNALSAGSNINISGSTISATNTWRGIQNNLTSTSTTDSLSAYQGYLLAKSGFPGASKMTLNGGAGSISSTSNIAIANGSTATVDGYYIASYSFSGGSRFKVAKTGKYLAIVNCRLSAVTNTANVDYFGICRSTSASPTTSNVTDLGGVMGRMVTWQDYTKTFIVDLTANWYITFYGRTEGGGMTFSTSECYVILIPMFIS